MHLTRHAMYEEVRHAAGNELALSERALGISGIANLIPLLGPHTEITDTAYPDVDMEALPFESGSFDVVISDQVIEHVSDPRTAVMECHRVLAEGGLAIHTTCFLNPLHPSPRDYFRFSPEGLAALCPPGAEIVACGGWGNRLALTLIVLWDRARFINIPPNSHIRRWLATFNEPKFAIVTWIVLRKTRQPVK